MTFNTNNNTERLRIDSNGNVGIGTSAPGYKLDVNGLAKADGYLVLPGEGYGLKLWSDDNYKISMGVSSNYQYGPVADYSIKTQMDAGNPGRGFTW